MRTELSFAGKVAVITGGGSGIGRAAALQFAALGAKIAICDVNAATAEETVALAVAAGGDGIAITVDVGDEQGVASAIVAVIRRWSRIDVLCNNAGVMDQMQGVARTSLATWERMMRTNATGAFLMMRAVLPHMIESKGGAIVNVASEAGIRGGAAGAAYTASKHAVIGLTRNTATMYRSNGIRCNAVCPGPTHTNIAESAAGPFDPQDHASLADVLAGMKRICQPDEIAAAIVFLASAAASNLNGAIVPVDGGWSAG
jgi:NAD(P)-dependent dehydrogenase (short-subunit alcohol dehydrogenase family)